jgi:hypothetical protein
VPTRHQKQQQWTPGSLKNWARDIGTDTLIWVSGRLDEREHPEQDRLVRQARFKLRASVQGIDYQHRRNLKKAQVAQLTQIDWLERRQNLLITSP